MLDLFLGFGALAAVLWFVVPFVRSTLKHNKEMKRLNEIDKLLGEALALPNGPERRAKLTEVLRRQGFPV